MKGRPLGQVEVEVEMMNEVGHLEALTSGGISPKFDDGQELMGYDQICALAAEAEADWKIAEAQGLIEQANRKVEGRAEPEYLRKARVLALKRDLYRVYKVSAAVKESSKEALTTSRARIDALRTIAANQRTQV